MRPVFVTAFLLVASVPAFAQGNACADMPNQLRTAASTSADAQAVRRALGYITTGEKLCEAGNDRAAGKKFKLAMKTLGLDGMATASAGAQ